MTNTRLPWPDSHGQAVVIDIFPFEALLDDFRRLQSRDLQTRKIKAKQRQTFPRKINFLPKKKYIKVRSEINLKECCKRIIVDDINFICFYRHVFILVKVLNRLCLLEIVLKNTALMWRNVKHVHGKKRSFGNLSPHGLHRRELQN